MGRMDDTEDDARYPTNPYHPNRNNGPPFPCSNRVKVPNRTPGLSPRVDRRCSNDDEEDESDANEEELNGDVHLEDFEQDEEEREEDGHGTNYHRSQADDDSSPDSRGKRRKLNKFAMGFEFAPRVSAPAAPVVSPAAATSSRGMPARLYPADWPEETTFVLLDAWGTLYVQNGRKSLRSDEWLEVAKKVNNSSRTPRSDAQCRNRLDTLKKKYKKERLRMAESMSLTTKWIYFKKMDELMGLPSLPQPPRQHQTRVPGGVASGECVFASSRNYLNRSNGLDETRDSPAGSELMGEDDNDDDESDGLPPQSTKKTKGSPNLSSFKMLADSIQKFSEIYEKMENSKRQHMEELERMRHEFHRDLEVQKRQILERAQKELEKIRDEEGEEEEDEEEVDEGEDNNDCIDGSAENASS